MVMMMQHTITGGHCKLRHVTVDNEKFSRETCISLTWYLHSAWTLSFDCHRFSSLIRVCFFHYLRFALLYITCMTIIWLFYFTFRAKEIGTPLNCTLGFLILASLFAIWITFTKYYKSYMMIVSSLYAILFIFSCLSWLYYAGTSLSVLGNFSICIICIICIYTVIPLKLYQCFLMALTYSSTFEVLSFMLKDVSYFDEKGGINIYKIIAIRIFLHVCVHIISFHMLLMSSVRMRGTFIKVGQNLLVRRQLELEKQLKEKMITSMMPKVVADILLKETQNDHEPSVHRHRPSNSDFNLKSMFRPFHMHSMKNVSILFADIQGFTKMSSTKTAEQLVEILNDLFERFDSLCSIYGCEKISTLGDCYYCVSGCPNARVSLKWDFLCAVFHLCLFKPGRSCHLLRGNGAANDWNYEDFWRWETWGNQDESGNTHG